MTFLKVDDAARILGVHKETLRRWDRSGKFKPTSRDIDGHRLYKKKDVVAFRAARAMAKKKGLT